MDEESKPKPVLVLSAPPKPPNEMTEEEMDEWAQQICDALGRARRNP
jgi:hypothetical protein